jgi:hypothetical protein
MRRLVNRDCYRTLMVVVLCAASTPARGFAQTLPPVILEIDLENCVDYFSDVADYSKLATDPSATTSMTRTLGNGGDRGRYRRGQRETSQGTYDDP